MMVVRFIWIVYGFLLIVSQMVWKSKRDILLICFILPLLFFVLLFTLFKVSHKPTCAAHTAEMSSFATLDAEIQASEDPASIQTTLASLFPHDELRQQMKSQKAFHDGWKEGQIEFLPTYKYDVGTVGVFDSIRSVSTSSVSTSSVRGDDGASSSCLKNLASEISSYA